jgi:hypothetical protein
VTLSSIGLLAEALGLTVPALLSPDSQAGADA